MTNGQSSAPHEVALFKNLFFFATGRQSALFPFGRYPMRIQFRHFVATLIAFAQSWSTVFSADKPEPIIELPTYPITGDSPWLIAEVEGFVVFSLADEKTTRRFTRILRESVALAPRFCPDTLGLPASAPPDLLLLEHMDTKAVTPSAKLSGLKSVTAFSFSLGDHALTFLTAKGQEWYFDKDNGLDLPVSRRFRLARPALPQWADDGRYQTCIYRRIIKGQMELERPRLSEKELKALAAALTYDQLSFQGGRLRIYTRHAFAHWAWTADGGRMRTRWESLAMAAAREPFTEAMFREHMRMSMAEADATLKKYLKEKAWKKEDTLVSPVENAGAHAVEVRRATGKEVRRYVGAAYCGIAESEQISESSRSFYMRKAIETLSASEADRAYGEIQTSLGLALFKAGDVSGARAALMRAVEAKTNRPIAYIQLAELTLSRKDAEQSVAVGPEEASEALSLVKRAWELGPELSESYKIAARACQVLGASDPELVKNLLPKLAQGTRFFPRDVALASEVIALHRLHGASGEADTLMRLALAWTPDAKEKLAGRP